ncbi:MAG: hypothetical protein CO108_18490 [Deltaproteobacteria bacterium CG_4_9_14_3_um_filter_63_12]|nr:MAG: hypothetical protein CO108_18490 [Deltaproteobacteria bacterium CG_4_9_14_3_um_filter_63_12]
MTVVQRFGSALQLIPHFHTVGCDGASSVDADGEARVVARILLATPQGFARLSAIPGCEFTHCLHQRARRSSAWLSRSMVACWRSYADVGLCPRRRRWSTASGRNFADEGARERACN